jgi:hypothetical protein
LFIISPSISICPSIYSPAQQYDQHLTEELFSTLFGGRTLETAPPPAASAASAIAPVRLSQTLV